jgi:hypothetical protein
VGSACGKHGRGEKRVQGFVGKARRKKPLERPRSRWENGIKMDLRVVGGVMSNIFTWFRIGLPAVSCECGDEPSGSDAMELVGYCQCKHLKRFFFEIVKLVFYLYG